MARGERRKCRSCFSLFRPDPRSRDRQQYCSAPLCKIASKAASQARWLAKPENEGYFRDPWHAARVREWRARKGSSSRKPSGVGIALQDVRTSQPVDAANKTGIAAASPLQEIITEQPAVLIGLIAHLVGTSLQDDIVHAARRLLRLGEDIIAASDVRPTGAVARKKRRMAVKGAQLARASS
jgi:hypothetical protein